MQGQWKFSVPFAATVILLLPFLNAENVRNNRQKSTQKNQLESPVLLNEHMSILSQFANLIDPEAYDFEILDVNGGKVSLNPTGPKPAASRRTPPVVRVDGRSSSFTAPVRTQTAIRKPVTVTKPESRLRPQDQFDINSIISSLQSSGNPVSAVPAGQSGYQTVLITPLEQLLSKAERRENAMVKTYVRQEKNLVVPVLPTERPESPQQVKMEGYMTKNDNSMAYFFNKVPELAPRQDNPPQPDIDVHSKSTHTFPLLNGPYPQEHIHPKSVSDSPSFNGPYPQEHIHPKSVSDSPSFNGPYPEAQGDVNPKPMSHSALFNKPYAQPQGGIHPKPISQSSVLNGPYPQSQGNIHPKVEEVFEALRLHQLKRKTKPKVQSSIKSTEGVLSPLRGSSSNGNENPFNAQPISTEMHRLNGPTFVPTEPATAFVPTEPATAFVPMMSPHNFQLLFQPSQIAPVQPVTENSIQAFSLPIIKLPQRPPPQLEPSTFWEPAVPEVTVPKQSPKPKVELRLAADVSRVKKPKPEPQTTPPPPPTSVSFKANFSFPSFNQARQRQRQRPRRPRYRTFNPPKLDYSEWKPITQRPNANEITESATKATKPQDPTNQNQSDLDAPVTSTITSGAGTTGTEENTEDPTSSPAKQNQGTSEGAVVISPVPLHKQRKIKMLRKKKRRFPSQTRSQIQQDVQLKNNGVTEPVPVKYSVSSSMSIHIPQSNKLLKFGDGRIKKQIRAAVVVGSRQPRTISQITRRSMRRQQLNAFSWLRSMSQWPARQINSFVRGAGRSMRRNMGSSAKKIQKAFDSFRRRNGNH